MRNIKIAITADIHYASLMDRERLELYLASLVEQKADILIIAGDLCTFGAEDKSFKELVSILGAFPGRVLFTPGNHDLWTANDSFNLLTIQIPEISKKYGCHILDGNPYVIGGTGIVGSVGWYDYTFHEIPEHLRKIFCRYIYKFSCSSGEKIIKWEEIGYEELLSKSCSVSEDGENWKQGTWTDKYYIHWKLTDEQFLDFTIKTLEKDIQEIYDKVDSIIAVIHHLPFIEFVPESENPIFGFHRAYLGSVKIGKLLQKYPKIKQVFFGHSHKNSSKTVYGMKSRNLYFHIKPETCFIKIKG